MTDVAAQPAVQAGVSQVHAVDLAIHRAITDMSLRMLASGQPMAEGVVALALAQRVGALLGTIPDRKARRQSLAVITRIIEKSMHEATGMKPAVTPSTTAVDPYVDLPLEKRTAEQMEAARG